MNAPLPTVSREWPLDRDECMSIVFDSHISTFHTIKKLVADALDLEADAVMAICPHIFDAITALCDEGTEDAALALQRRQQWKEREAQVERNLRGEA